MIRRLKMYFTAVATLLFALSLQKVEAKGEPTPNLNLKFAISTGARFQIDQYFQMNDVITNRTMCTSSDPRVKVAYKFDKSDEEIKSFHITTNGELTMAENARQLSCQNSSCDYQLNITCWAYLHNENELLAQADITITVVYRLVNKFRPEFADSTLNITLPENLKHENHPIITTLNAIDQDSDECDDIRYSITSGNGGGYFQLDPHTGTLTLVSPLNFERDSQFSLTVQAANALCSPQLSSTMTVYIRVLKVDSATETVNDLLPVGTLIASSTPGSNALIFLNTSNADQLSNEGQFQFSFAVMDDFVTEYFELNIDTGDLTLIKSLKYKYCLKPTFSNQIVISIRLCGAGESECSIFDINLTVSISSDCSTSFDQNKYTIPVNESTPVGLKLYNITCRSPGNLEANTNRKYSVVHGHSVFNLSGNTLVLNTPLDYESETEFISVIECRDLILERENTATATIIIKVLPSNEYNPKLTQPFYTYTLSSFEGVQFPLVIGHIQAHDNDSGAGGELVYRLDNSADSRFLQIGANGTLSLIGSLDSRTCDKLVVVVEVSDGLFTDRATVLINTPVIGQTKSSNCDVFCIAFIASTILLVLSLVIHIVTFIAIVIYYKKKQRERVVKFQESILEISKRNSQRRSTSENASHFSNVHETVTVPCPMYSSMPSVAKGSNGHYPHTSNGRRRGMELPPVPAQAYERPLSRKISGKSDFGDYLEMSSVMKRDRCNSDPALSRKCSRDEAESETLGCRTVPLVLEEGRRGLKKKVSLLGDGDITSERRSVDNIYDFIAP